MGLRLAVVVGVLVLAGAVGLPALEALKAAPLEPAQASPQGGSPVAVAVVAPPVPEAEAPGAEAPEPEVEAPEPEAPEVEVPEAEAPEAEAPEPEAPEAEDDTVWVGPPDAIPDCDAQLAAAGIEFSPSTLPLHKTRSGIYCGAEQVVRYRKGPGAIRWGGSPKVTCPVALGMARLEAIVQEEAEREFGRKVRRIQHMGTYNCREMANYPGWVSEHSYANAIDIKHFELANGKTIPVLGTYPKNGAVPKTAGARFLKAVARRLFDERVFAVVLTPSFDAAHRNHFHLDMARYVVDGT